MRTPACVTGLCSACKCAGVPRWPRRTTRLRKRSMTRPPTCGSGLPERWPASAARPTWNARASFSFSPPTGRRTMSSLRWRRSPRSAISARRGRRLRLPFARFPTKALRQIRASRNTFRAFSRNCASGKSSRGLRCGGAGNRNGRDLPPMKFRLAVSFLFVVAALPSAVAAEAPSRPNIVFILADDIGYGDVGCYGATLVETPNIDRLARQGRRFTDAHSPASTCTPTRRALLTGAYSWRQEPGSSIAPGDAPLSIPPGTATLPALLKQAGYTTGAVGKWHLGLG